MKKDLKPQNILISDNNLKIADFGFAKKLSENEMLERKYYIHFIKSMKGYDKDLRLQAINNNDTEARFFNFRDTVMSENLSFLLNEAFKDKKVIISTATSHITKNVSKTWVDKQMNLYENMMTHLSNDILNKSYIISFLDYEGKSGRPGSMLNQESNFPTFSANSLEYLLSQKCNFGFLDFNKNKKLKPYLESKTISPILSTPLNINWFSMYDGFFFIKKMKPIEMSIMVDRANKIINSEDFKNISK